MPDAPDEGLPSERARVAALQTLRLPRRATREEVRAVYLRLARELHPDRNPDDSERTARFQEVAAAYELLRRYYRNISSSETPDPRRRQKPAGFDERWWAAFGDRV